LTRELPVLKNQRKYGEKKSVYCLKVSELLAQQQSSKVGESFVVKTPTVTLNVVYQVAS
jgi:hypothetical protein